MKAERQSRILEFIKDKDIVKTKEIEEELEISKATLNRDLIELEELGVIQRSHGGVIGGQAILTYEPLQHEKEMKDKECKIALAREAIKLIPENSSFIIDSGSTMLYLAKEIVKMEGLNKKIFATNDLKNAMTLATRSEIELLVLGGRRRNGLYSLYGDLTKEAIERLCVDVYFMGADAIDTNSGVTNVNFEEVSIKKSMMKAAKKIVLLVDHTKFSKIKVAKVCDINQIDMIITDNKTNLSDIEKIRSVIDNVVVVERR